MKLQILIAALLFGGMAFGQEKTTKNEKPKTEQREKKTPKTAEERAGNITERLTNQLGLSADQKEKIYEINLGIAQKNDGIRANTTLSKDERKKLLLENHSARKAMYKEVLTAEQFAKYEAWEAEKKAKMEAKKKERQTDKAAGKKGGKGTKATTHSAEEDEDSENEL